MTDSFTESENKPTLSISPRLLTALILITIPLLFFYPALLGQVVLMPGDGWVQNFGVRVLAGNMLASGQLPLWNPYIFAGMPLLASVYPGVLYPLNWLFAILPPVAAMNTVVILTYELAIIGSYFYARKIGSSRTGALIGASLFTLGGFMIVHLGHTSRIAAAAWLPWVLLALEHLYRNARWRWVMWGAVFLGLQFVAGEPQMTFNTALVCGVYVLFCLLLRRESAHRIRFLTHGFVMAVCGALFSLALYLPARELQQQGARAQLDYNYFAAFSLPPQQLLAFIFPYFFGGGGIAPYLQAPWGNSFWGETSVSVSAGYTGLLGLMLALIAICRFRRNALICFWAVVAMLSLLLALGDYLPFGLNQLLYRVPVYNLFRGSYRHLLEYTFAVATLAGLGVTEIARLEWKTRKLIVTVISALMGTVVGAIAILYCFWLDRFPAAGPRLKEFGQLSNPEAFVPILCFVAGAICLWLYARQPTLTTKALLIFIAIVDVATFGWFFEWHNAKSDLITRLPDAATVKFIKSKESDLHAFRIVSQGALPFSYNYEALNFPNNSILRGLQSVNGYDVLQLERFKEIAGEMTAEGKVQDRSAFGLAHRGLDLLNVKYFLRERNGASIAGREVSYEGIQFAETPINLKLARSDHFEAGVKAAPATEIAIISALANSADLADNTPLLKIKLHTTDQKIIARELLVGRDSSEWAHDRPDVKAGAKHRRATVIESYPAETFEGHRYLARIKFDRAEIERIEIDFVAPNAEIIIARAALHDAVSGVSTQFDSEELAPDRWRKLETFGNVEVYENLRLLPRVWLAKRIEVKPRNEVVQIIKTGAFSDGTSFDPQETALLELEDFGGRQFSPPPTGALDQAQVKITQYTAQRIRIETENPAPSFLVLSEMYYRGWDARIDGAKAPVYRVNHALRGLSLPAGKHQIEFVYCAPSLRTGVVYSIIGILLLSIGAVVIRKLRIEDAPLPAVTEDKEERFSTSSSVEGLVPPRLRELFSLALPPLSKIITPQNLLALLLIGYGAFTLRNAAYAVAGSDATGYINTARAILQNNIVEPIAPLQMLDLPESFEGLFRPLAYLPGPRPGTMTPFYPIGMSLHMLSAAVIAGWQNGPFLISPLAAVLCIWVFYLLGAELGLARWLSLSGSIILAACPVFIFISLLPMSDVLATFWALLTIYAALRSRRNEYWALLVGAAFGMAFLVRPNNVFLLLPLLFCFRWKPKIFALFVLGGVPLALGFFAFNRVAYGHILQTGYGAIELYRVVKVSNFAINFKNYVGWLVLGMSPLILLGWLATAVDRQIQWRERGLLLSWFGVFFLFYCFYEPYHAWWFSRFLLPGIPALILGTLLVLQHVGARLAPKLAMSATMVQGAAAATLLAIVFGFAWQNIQREYVLNIGIDQYVHSRSCRWADGQLPQQSLIVAMEMSGALNYYTNRSILRYDFARPDQWQTLTKRAAEKDYRWYALLMPHELTEAQKRVTGKWSKVGDYQQISLWQIEPVP